MIERLVVAPPAGSSKMVSDLRIGGEPVVYGGQIAECITVKLNGGAHGIGTVANNLMLACTDRCCASAQNGLELATVDLGTPLPAGAVAAVTPEGGDPAPAGRTRLTQSLAMAAVRHRNPARATVGLPGET
jgi:hypothetical protein